MATLQMVKAIKLESVFLKIVFLAIFGVLSVQDSAYAFDDSDSDFEELKEKKPLHGHTTATRTVSGDLEARLLSESGGARVNVVRAGAHRVGGHKPRGDFSDSDDALELHGAKKPLPKKHAGVVVVNKSPSSSDERDRSGSSSNIPSANTSGTSIEVEGGGHILPVPMLGGSAASALLLGATAVAVTSMDEESSEYTKAFLRHLSTLDDPWDIKAWAAYFLFGAFYGYCGPWRSADYAQMVTTDVLPESSLWALGQKQLDKISDFAFNEQFYTAFTARVLYGCLMEVPEWISSLRDRHRLKKSFPFVETANELKLLGPSQKPYLKWSANILSLLIAGAISVVDASIYARFRATAILSRTLASRDPLAPYELAAGTTFDGFYDIREHDIDPLLQRYHQRGEGKEERTALKKATKTALHWLQTCFDDEEIDKAFVEYARQKGSQKFSKNSLRYLLTLGKGTALPDRRLRNYSTKAVAAFLMLLAIHPNWVMGNDIMGVNVARDSPTPASAALGALNVGLLLAPTFRGVKDLGNELIDLFAPEKWRLPHSTHRSGQYSFMRAFDIFHAPVAFVALAMAAAGATALTLYFLMLPDPLEWDSFKANLSKTNTTANDWYANITKAY